MIFTGDIKKDVIPALTPVTRQTLSHSLRALSEEKEFHIGSLIHNVPGFISPLHDKDLNADGEPKKPHWHVLLTFKGNKSFEQVKEITNSLNAPIPQACKDIRAYARYLCHLDNPEKAQYEVSDVESLGGADYLDKIKSAADTDTAVSEMMDWCIEQGCYSFFRLSNYARKNRTDWFRVISSSRTVFLVAWLKSMEWEIRNGNPIE